jgi:hypothetical protein
MTTSDNLYGKPEHHVGAGGGEPVTGTDQVLLKGEHGEPVTAREHLMQEISDLTPPTNPAEERDEVLFEFCILLGDVTRDGSSKRQAGQKPSWKVDPSHMAAVFSHLKKYFAGEIKDPDSGQHPLVHAAWRLLAIAWQDKYSYRGVWKSKAP